MGCRPYFDSGKEHNGRSKIFHFRKDKKQNLYSHIYGEKGQDLNNKLPQG